MAHQRLIDYLREQRSKGYSLFQLRQSLITHGYSKKEVDSAIDQLYGKAIIPSSFHKPFVIGVVVVALLIVGLIIGLLVPKTQTVPEQLLDVELEIVTPQVRPGSDIVFNVELSNLGSSTRYDILLLHEILNQQGETIVSSEESVAIQTRVAKASRLPIPAGVDPGQYRLRTTARYEGLPAVASLSFSVVGPTSTINPPSTVPQPDQEPLPLVDQPEQPSRSSSDEETVRSFSELIEQIKIVAQSDLSQATQHCENSFSQQIDKDGCLLEIALFSKKSFSCNRISDMQITDDCYLQIALTNEDPALCDRIQDESLASSCTTRFS